MNILLNDQNYTNNQALGYVSAPKEEKVLSEQSGNVNLYDSEELTVWQKSSPSEYTSSIRLGNFGRDIQGNITESFNSQSHPAILLYDTNEQYPLLDIGVIPSSSGKNQAVISFKKLEDGENVEYASLKLDKTGNLSEKSTGTENEIVSKNSNDSIISSNYLSTENKENIVMDIINTFRRILRVPEQNNESSKIDTKSEKFKIDNNGNIIEFDQEVSRNINGSIFSKDKSMKIEKSDNKLGDIFKIVDVSRWFRSTSNNEQIVESELNAIQNDENGKIVSFEKENTKYYGDYTISENTSQSTNTTNRNDNIIMDIINTFRRILRKPEQNSSVIIEYNTEKITTINGEPISFNEQKMFSDGKIFYERERENNLDVIFSSNVWNKISLEDNSKDIFDFGFINKIINDLTINVEPKKDLIHREFIFYTMNKSNKLTFTTSEMKNLQIIYNNQILDNNTFELLLLKKYLITVIYDNQVIIHIND